MTNDRKNRPTPETDAVELDRDYATDAYWQILTKCVTFSLSRAKLIRIALRYRRERDAARMRVKWFELAGGVAMTIRVYQQAAQIKSLKDTVKFLERRIHHKVPQ